MKKVIFLKNAAILTATSLLLRFLGVVLKIWLASAIGSEGIGLYQLIFSFYVLAATFATSGICTAVTRLVADELCLGSAGGIKKIMKSSFFLTICAAFISAAAVICFSNPISVYIVGDARAAVSLKILAFPLVFMGISSCIRGFFLARRKTLPPSTSQIFEHTIRIISMLFFVNRYAPLGIEAACYAVFLSDLVAEAAACFYLYFFYRHDTHYLSRLSGRANPNYSVYRRLLQISAPISGGKYINSILRTIENSLVPARLMLSGLTQSGALSAFGMIKGMVLPILFFPSSLLGSLATLLIPEVSEALAAGRKNQLAHLTGYILQITSAVGFLFGAIFFVAGEEIGMLVYKDIEVGRLIVRLAPIVPLMYLDSIADGLLKGMDQQVFTLYNSVIDSAVRIVLVLVLLQTRGMDGFILIMYISNAMTCFANVARLIKCSGAKMRIFSGIVLPISAAVGITATMSAAIERLVLPQIAFVGLLVVVCSVLYFGVLVFSKSISFTELRRM